MEKLDLLELSLSWFEFWATLACGIVAIGLIIEYKSEFKKAILEKSVKLLPLGALLVTAGVALEFIFQIQTAVLLSKVRGVQHDADLKQRVVIEGLKKETSDANERTAKAELALARMNAPRVITGANGVKLMNAWRQYAGKTFWIITEKSDIDVGGEQELLAEQISRVFFTAGWKKESHWSRFDETKTDPEHTPISNRGCQINFSIDISSRNLGKLVSEGLREAGIDCRSQSFPEIKPEHVIVEIGLR